MISLTKTEKCIYRGVVYRYVNRIEHCLESGKNYVGCSLNEEKRRKDWGNRNNPYSGWKIALARKLYFDFFKYELLGEFWSDNIEELKKYILKKEKEYIKLFDSENKGYNINQHKPKTLQHRLNISKGMMGHTVSDETRKKISASHSKTQVWISTPTLGTVKMESMSEAAKFLNRSIGFVYGRTRSKNTNPKDNIIITLAA